MAGRSQQTNRINPLKLLPPHMQEHIRPKTAGLKGWAIVCFALVAFGSSRYMLADNSSQSARQNHTPSQLNKKHYAATSTNAASTQATTAGKTAATTELEIKVKGLKKFKIKHKTKGVRFYWDQKTYKLEIDGDKLELKIGGEGTQYHLKKKADKWNLYQAGARVYHVKTPDGGKTYALYDNNNTKLFRVKTKANSFNVYDGTGKRLYKGKEKYGNYVVRDKADESKALTISGDITIQEAAMLSIPVEPPFLALLYLSLQ